MLDIRDRRHVEQQWVKRSEDVFMRERWDGDEDWGEWKLTPMREVPYIIMEKLCLLR